ncbi:MAG: radical SAM protein [Deltaproteobacteria bacterium]|nr:radical SAM protein [Deltaproteobacteria bacterium]
MHELFIVPVFVPHSGCPHRCVYCNQTTITGINASRLSAGEVRSGIRRFLDYKGPRRSRTEIAFYGGNFLGLHPSYGNMLLDIAQRFVDDGTAQGVRFSTRPDSVTPEALEALAPYTVRVVELGAQSMDNRVLNHCRRNHQAQDTARAVGLLRAHGLGVGIQIMPGLPGDTRASILETGLRVAELQPDVVRIYPTVVIKNTELERWYRSGRFVPLTLARAVEIVTELYDIFATRNVTVIRMGLQASTSLLKPGTVVAGPFHPAFGHMVHSRRFLDLAIRVLDGKTRPFDRVTVRVFPGEVSRAVGHRRENIRALIKRFGLRGVQVVGDPHVPAGTLRVAFTPGVHDAQQPQKRCCDEKGPFMENNKNLSATEK